MCVFSQDCLTHGGINVREPLRFSWRHWWNYVLVAVVVVGIGMWRYFGLDGRVVLFSVLVWVVFGRIFVPSIIHEHIGFIDRWIFNDYDKANQRYRRAVDTGKATAQAYCALGSLSYAEGDTAEAARLLEEGCNRLPRDVHALALLSKVLGRLGRHPEALAAAIRCQEISGRSPLSYVVLGDALKEQGDLEAAASAYQKALGGSPDLFECHLKLGEIYFLRGELQAAENEFEKALRISPKNPDVLFWLGKVAISRKDPFLAKRYFQRSLERRAMGDYTSSIPYEEVVGALGDLGKVSR